MSDKAKELSGPAVGGKMRYLFLFSKLVSISGTEESVSGGGGGGGGGGGRGPSDRAVGVTAVVPNTKPLTTPKQYALLGSISFRIILRGENCVN
jgi:hypothetical protein